MKRWPLPGLVFICFLLAFACDSDQPQVTDEPECGNNIIEGDEECDGGDDCDDSCHLRPAFALRLDAGLLTGTTTYGGYEFVPLMPYIENTTEDRDSCNVDNDYCDHGLVKIGNTEHDQLYNTQIWSCGDSLDISIDVPNDTYTIYLHNAETTEAHGSVGGRIATIEAEGQTVISAWDIYVDAGEAINRAVRRSFEVTVSDGSLDVTMLSDVQCAKICGIEILSGSQNSLRLEDDEVCIEPSECGTDYASDDYCYDGDVYHDWHEFSCDQGVCSEDVERQLTEDCGDGTCVEGQCQTEDPCAALDCHDDDPCTNDGCEAGECVYTAVESCFDIVFSQNFNDNPVGAYLRTTWSEDWGLPVDSWSDPCYRKCADEEQWAGARLTIGEEDDGNRFLSHELISKGTSPGTSGTSWWLGIGHFDELYLSYRIRFSGDDWDGPTFDGKLPGFCGSAGCPGGGNPPDHEDGFSTRYMFKGYDSLFFYLYFAGMDTSDGPYGDGLYFSPYENSVGEWHTITQRVVMNTPGTANGIVEGFLDGVLVAQRTDMDFRNSLDQDIATLYFANFLGGSGAEPSDTGDTPDIDFDDFVIYAYSDDVTDVPRGLTPSPSDRVIHVPSP